MSEVVRPAGDAFLEERDRLWGLAYRMLGSRSDADDVVQDAWLRWQGADQEAIERPAAWLTTVTSRLAIDRLRARRQENERYVGPWLPEPISFPSVEDPTDLADSITVGFLALLERLDPVERVVFLLADVFREPFADIAAAVGRSEAACRQLASRARRRVHDPERHRGRAVSRSEKDQLLQAFSLAAVQGDLDALTALLAPDVVLVSDGGPDRHAARRPVVGPARVARFLANVTKRFPAGLSVRTEDVNGEPGLVVERKGRPVWVLVLHITDLGIEDVFIVVNPDKLHALSQPARPAPERAERHLPERYRRPVTSGLGEPTSDEQLLVTREGPVATLWLNRPGKRNAVSEEMWVGIAEHCQALADDRGVRVLVVRGVGGHFCAGADIGGLADRHPGRYEAATRSAEESLAHFPKPTIAFITGSCVGGGAELAIACDLRLSDTTGRFGITPARLGIVYPAFAVERAVRLIGPSAAKHLLFSAELIDAARALRIGLVDEVHEPAHAEARLHELTTLLATERSLLTQQASKQMVDAVAADGTIGAELTRRWAAELAASGDLSEGISAFLERRTPRFTWTGPASSDEPDATR